MVLSWDGKDLDAILAFTKMRAEPMVFDVPMLVASSKTGRICGCNVQSGLVVFKCMADERDRERDVSETSRTCFGDKI